MYSAIQYEMTLGGCDDMLATIGLEPEMDGWDQLEEVREVAREVGGQCECDRHIGDGDGDCEDVTRDCKG